MAKHGFLWLAALVTTARSFPSFRHHVPNGLRVPCPSGATGCDLGDASLGEPDSVCRGLGDLAWRLGGKRSDAVEESGHQDL